jgi:hypothetical protein
MEGGLWFAWTLLIPLRFRSALLALMAGPLLLKQIEIMTTTTVKNGIVVM